jgi:serine phosphatase RsbU (regulator of sigma subunit)
VNGVFMGVGLGANFIAAISMSFVYPLIRTETEVEVILRTLDGLGALWLLSFAIPSLIGLWYVAPMFRAPRDEIINHPSPLVKKRLLNAPLILSLVGVTGWLTAIASFFCGAFVNHVPLRWGTGVGYAIDMLLTGSLVFVITYYLLEFINRRYFIAWLFPDGKLSAVSGVIDLSIRARFYIYFFAAAVFPIFLFYNIFGALRDTGEAEAVMLPVTVFAVVVLLLGGFVTYLISNAYQAPLVKMKQATERVRAGDYATEISVVSTDEVGRLGEALNEMAVGLREREIIKAAHAKVEQELAVAWRIQASFLPAELPQVPGWQVAATLEPARQTSGDFYDIIPLGDGRLGLLVADVTDKGVGAALYMALSRTLIRTYAVEHGAHPELALSAAHRRILADSNTSQFVTVFYGVLDPASGALTYGNAGHNPPLLLFRRNGTDAPAEFQELETTGPALGLRLLKDVTWEQRTVQLGPGDVLVLYTDGVTEAVDAQEELFGEERLWELLQVQHGASAQLIQEAVIGGVQAFVGPAPQYDDITLMVLVRSGEL